MAFYLSPLPAYKCRCGKKATHALKTSGTVTYAYYCRRCGEREVKFRNNDERTAKGEKL